MIKDVLVILFRPFHKEPKRDHGYYSKPKGSRRHHLIEVKSNDPIEEQDDTLGHEFGHYLWRLRFGTVQDPDQEEAFCREVGDQVARILRKHRRPRR